MIGKREAEALELQLSFEGKSGGKRCREELHPSLEQEINGYFPEFSFF